jgi:hypothetical protein
MAELARFGNRRPGAVVQSRMARRWTLGVALLAVAGAACGSSNDESVTTASIAPDTVVTQEAIDVETTIAPTPSSAAAGPVTAPDTSAAIVVAAAASCAFEYTDETLAERSWAFDGTLIAMSSGTDSQLGVVPTATFAVNHWYRGGVDDEVTIEYEPGGVSELVPSADAGTRLLVTGEPRWGGAPLDDAVAWGCGFSQAWTSSAAERWSTVFAA